MHRIKTVLQNEIEPTVQQMRKQLSFIEAVFLDMRNQILIDSYKSNDERQAYKLIISLNLTACLRLTLIFSPPMRSTNRPPLK